MNIRLIGTGGTIASVPGGNGLAPGLAAKELLGFIDAGGDAVDCFDLFNLDSSNIQPEEWQRIAETVRDARGRYDAVVITHGTDTMAYTASMLTFLLQNIEIPVVLTGSQLPILYPDSDGRANLQNALIAARKLRGGVYVCFGSAIIKGCRAVKTRTTSLNAFESINYPYIGTVANGQYFELFTPPETGAFAYYPTIEPRIALIKLIPGTDPAIIKSLAACNVRGVVVEAFGLGGVHSFRRDHAETIRELIEAGIPVVLSSQCLYESSTPDVYAVSRPLKEAGVIPAYDMTREAAVTKLMWALAQPGGMETIRERMLTDLCGEIRR